MRIAIILIAASLTGCVATSEIVKMQNPQNGLTVTCGPYQRTGATLISNGASTQANIELRTCVHDYQAAGYQRTQ